MNEVQRNTVNFGQVKRSIQDLTRIYKPPRSKARSFVEWFVKRYHVQRGFENELERIVKEEIQKLQAGEQK